MLIYVLLLLTIASIISSQIFEVELDSGYKAFNFIVFNITIGGMTFESILFSNLEDLMVVDSKCGKPISGCPRYCSDTHFCHYCNPLCCGISENIQNFLCGEDLDRKSLYNVDNSTTYRPIASPNNVWTRKFDGWRKFSGLYGLEKLVISSVNTGDQLIDSNFKFVRGLMIGSGALLGISPGEDTAIKRLYKSGIIKSPLLSIAFNASRIVFGAEANEYCENDWNYYPTLSKSIWSFMVDAIKITGINDIHNVKVISDPSTPNMKIPKQIVIKLYETGAILYFGPYDNQLVFNCSASITFEFVIKDQTFILDKEDIVSGGYDDICYVYVETDDDPNQYTDFIEWRLGAVFFEKVCHTFNYVDNKIGFASNKF